jgi:hypothetical protein
MAGKGYKIVKDDQYMQSMHFRLPNYLFEQLDVFCAEHRIKKQALFEHLAKAIVSKDERMLDLVEEAIAEKKQKSGLDELDLEQIKKIIASHKES